MRRARIFKHATVDAIQRAKTTFEEHKLLFTIGTSILSAGAAWAGYCARQLHQQHVERRLDSIERAMNVRREDMNADDIKLLTKTGIGFKACFATLGTVSILTYALGWRSGRSFTLKQIHRKQQKLLAATAKANQPPRFAMLKNSLRELRPLSALRRRKKLEHTCPSPQENAHISTPGPSLAHENAQISTSSSS